MIQFIIGLVVFIFGLLIMPIPIVGWFFGILSMLIGFIMILSGIFGGSSDENRDNIIVQNEVSTADELSKLSQLLKDEILTQEEFDIQKQNILNKK